MRDEKITCDYCGADIAADHEWRITPALALRKAFTRYTQFDCCIECMSELEAKRKTK
jgi:hypothetical protein